MTDDALVIQAAAELAREGKPFVMATVVATQGRTPRDAGARMIWQPGAAAGGVGGPNIIGTVGGGRMEQMVIEVAEAHFFKRSAGVEKMSLLQDADQCCGGTMEVFLEYIGPRQRAVIFGAGHVSMALAKLLVESPIEVVVADDRRDWNTEERFPQCRRVMSFAEGLAAAAERPGETFVCVMTYCHDTDFDLLKSVLLGERPSPGPLAQGGGAWSALPAYVGLIGSRSKRACFFGRLSAAGVPQELIDKVECPMGLGDMGKSPQQVAISIAGRLLLEAKAHAKR